MQSSGLMFRILGSQKQFEVIANEFGSISSYTPLGFQIVRQFSYIYL